MDTTRQRINKVFRQIDRDLDWCIISALNKTATSARSQIIKFIRQDYNIKASELRSLITIKRAKRNRPHITIMFENKPIGLFSFKARQTKKGLSYEIRKGAGRKKIESGFIAEFNYPGAFIRKGKERGPLKKLFGPTSAQLFKSEEAQNELVRILEDTFYTKLNQQVKYKFN